MWEPCCSTTLLARGILSFFILDILVDVPQHQTLYFYFYFFKDLIFNLFLAALGLRCCMRAFSSCGERGLLFVVVHGLLIEVASLVAEHGL